MTISQNLSDAIDSGNRIDATVTDFSKALIEVPLDLILQTLKITGIEKRVLAWISSFLRI